MANNLKEAREASKSGYWQVPNSFMKRVRQLSMNDLRAKVFELAGALMDQRNANAILMEQLKELKAKAEKPSVTTAEQAEKDESNEKSSS